MCKLQNGNSPICSVSAIFDAPFDCFALAEPMAMAMASILSNDQDISVDRETIHFLFTGVSSDVQIEKVRHHMRDQRPAKKSRTLFELNNALSM